MTRQPSIFRLCIWLLGYARRRWTGLVAVLSAMLLGNVLTVLKPWPMKIVIDNVLLGKPLHALALSRERLLLACIAATILIFLLNWILTLAGALAHLAFGQRMVYDLAADLFDHLQRLSLRFHARKTVGDSIRRVTSDCGCVSIIVKDALLPVISSLFSLALMFTIMWKMDRALTLLSLAVVPMLAMVLRAYAEPMMQTSYAEQEAEGRIYDVVEQSLSAAPVVQAFGREEFEDRRFRAGTAAIIDTTLAAASVQLQFKVLTGAAMTLGTIAIIWVGAQHVLAGSLSVGGVLVFLAYLASLYAPLERLMYTSSMIQGAAGSAQRVMEILETKCEVADRPGARAISRARGEVRIENVTFGYESDRAILQHISLQAHPGETIAIVGPTGAGKSTLVSLLPRFFDPWQGRVTLDGHDVNELKLKDLRWQIAVVLQESFLFPLSIAQNIAYGRPDASIEDIIAAATAANIHEFITSLSKGYDTIIGERGATLSGGERQRLSIARALLKDAPVLILDEPTASLDTKTESLLLEALQRLMRGRTTFIIAHRLSTIRQANEILVLDNGTICETGTHDELISRGGLYARLHELQTVQPAEASA